MDAPAQLMIVCPACPPQQLIAISVEATQARCPTCRRYFRLVTRELKSVQTSRLEAQRVRIDVLTFEGERSRSRPRHFEALPTVHLTPGHWITLVYRGPRLLGIAEQTTSIWHPLPLFAVGLAPLRRLIFLLSVVCLLLAALQLDRLVPALQLISKHPSGVAALALVGGIALAPALLWALQTGWSARARSYLPPSAASWQK